MQQSQTAHILVVDDEPAIRFSLGAFLEDCGHAVLLAASGTEARSLFETHPIRKAIVDMRLPDMSGEELVLLLAPLHPDTEFFIFTGSLDYIPPPELHLWGVTEQKVLHKPLVDLEQVLVSLGL